MCACTRRATAPKCSARFLRPPGRRSSRMSSDFSRNHEKRETVKLHLKRTWPCYDGNSPHCETSVDIPAGTHEEVERIPHPLHSAGSCWLALSGTKFGKTEKGPVAATNQWQLSPGP